MRAKRREIADRWRNSLGGVTEDWSCPSIGEESRQQLISYFYINDPSFIPSVIYSDDSRYTIRTEPLVTSQLLRIEDRVISTLRERQRQRERERERQRQRETEREGRSRVSESMIQIAVSLSYP
jgi:hypothetical protein